ncbi:Panacea domain-containing protein [Candidatus Hydrogenedentota bacterium]
MPGLTALDVAKYFLSKMSDECGDVISNLKLQKLVYYAQGFHLALMGRPLFKEQIKAWQHGPVIPSLYDKYKEYEARGIPRPDSIDLSKYDKPTVELLDEVYEVFGQFSAWKLRNMTHEEPPWKDTPMGGVITCPAMKKYFETQLTN